MIWCVPVYFFIILFGILYLISYLCFINGK